MEREARLLSWVRLMENVDLCRGDATWWMTRVWGEQGRVATARGASAGRGAGVSWSWPASLTGDKDVRKGPGGAGGPALLVLFRAAFLRSFCRRRLSFPGLGSSGGGGPGGPGGRRAAISGATEAAEVSIAAP